MTDARGALTFLIVRSVRNRLARQLARIRRPRYAIAAIVGIAYFWLLFARPGGAPDTIGFGPAVGTLFGIGLAITVLRWWIFGGLASALGFQPAEVQLLFTAPLSRRALIGYRLVRYQPVLLLSCLIWTLLIGRWGAALAAPMRFAGVWALFTVLGLHRLGVALTQIEPVRGGRAVARSAGRALGVAAGLALALGLSGPLMLLGRLGVREGMRAVPDALASPPAAWALAPVRLILAPLYAQSPLEWTTAFALVLLIVVLHLVWVLAMDVEFEETAATSSTELARMVAAYRERRAGGAAVIRSGKPVRDWLPLAPTGAPAIAIVWKNTLAFVRGGGLRTVVLTTLVVAVASRVSAGTAGGGAAGAIVFATLAVMSFLFGPRMLRNDLRMDLLSLPSLKSYPLDGAMVVSAELASPALLLSAYQLTVLGLAYLSLPSAARAALSDVATVTVAIVAPLAVLVLNAVNLAVQNAAALLFPTWVRLGADSGGFEAMGQSLLVSIGSILVLAVGLVGPGVAAGVVAVAASDFLGSATPAAALWAAASVLALELVVAVVVLGRIFDRMDATSAAT